MRSRMVGSFELPVLSWAEGLIIGTFGGGLGGLTPRNVSRKTLPRVTVEIRAQADAAEPAAVDVMNPVVLGEPFVDERVVGVQQVEHAAILLDDRVEQELDLAAKRDAQVVVEIRIDAGVRRH